jgi:hypothetical protein
VFRQSTHLLHYNCLHYRELHPHHSIEALDTQTECLGSYRKTLLIGALERTSGNSLPRHLTNITSSMKQDQPMTVVCIDDTAHIVTNRTIHHTCTVLAVAESRHGFKSRRIIASLRLSIKSLHAVMGHRGRVWVSKHLTVATHQKKDKTRY